MPTDSSISIPQAALWLLRLAVNPTLSRNLQRDPVAFAAWYAAIGEVIDWPKEVQDIQDSERARRLSLERMMKLLSQVHYTFSGRTNAEHARAVLEGYAVHEWVHRHPQEFIDLASARLKSLALLRKSGDPIIDLLSPFSARLHELGRTLKLSPLEHDILSFAFLSKLSDELIGIFEQLAADRRTAGILWSAVFDTTAEELARAMRPSSPLRLSGILQAAGRRAQFASVSSFWVELLAGADSLTAALLEPLESKPGSGRPARLFDEDRELAIRLLSNAREAGVNLLLYGPTSLDKQQLLEELISGCGRTAWRVPRLEDAPSGVLPSLTFVAFQLLAQKSGDNLLVIERPSEVLHTGSSHFFSKIFGIEMEPEDTLPFDENLLGTNPVPGLWLASESHSLLEDTVARFVFHAPLKKADRAVRECAIRSRLGRLKLGKDATAQILKLEGVSSAQLESAVKAARLARPRTKGDQDHAIVQAIRRSQRALSRDLSEASKPSVTQYSLEFLNTSGRFSPEQILKCFRKRPKGSVLLYGPPGTGKTQFVEYVAEELGLPLVSKSASTLLSKWVGESEKNIAAAFEAAAAEDAILFFDEGDSFLRSRTMADHSWEVTQTNELLQKMERFDGIVMVATNLFRNLDSAALRRFTFKIEFRELDLTQRWNMFVAETGLSGKLASIATDTRESWEKRLLFMRYLTPGDFATVKRQCIALDTQLSPEEWLEQLEIECKVKGEAAGAAT